MRWPRPAALLFAALGIALISRLATLDAFPLIDPTEGRYAEIPREMLASGDWITPRLEPDQSFWAKPPLVFWTIATAYRLFGVSEFSARLPSLIFSALTCAATGWLGARMFGATAGLLAALVLASSGLFFVLAGVVIVDPALAMTTTLSAGAFLASTRVGRPREALALGLVGFASLGLSTLVKGLLGPALLVLTAAAWACTGSAARGALRALPWRSGLLLAAAVAVPWHLAAELRTPGFLRYYLVGEHLQRFLNGEWNNLYGAVHAKPPGSIWAYFLVASLPWSLGVAWRAARQGASLPRRLCADPVLAFLTLWMLVPLLLFTFYRGLLITYALPSLPPFALLTACGLRTVLSRSLRPVLATALLVPVLFPVVALGVMPALARERSQAALAHAFEEGCPPGGARHCVLVYADDVPAGDFYTRGRAVELRGRSSSDVARKLGDEVVHYFAVRRQDRGWLPHQFWERTDSLGSFGRYELRREQGKRRGG